MRLVKKAISFVVSAFAVLILSGFLSLRPIGGEFSLGDSGGDFPVFAHHIASHACNDISGSTTPVLSPDRPGRRAGVEDSGQLDFNADPPVMDYQACGETAEATIGSVTGNPILGWAWNTNLGYISFSCNGGTNLGSACGNIDYQTIIGNNGQINGWAWGDNIGWISMTCRNGDNVGQDCGRDVGANYSGVRVAQDVTEESAEAERADCVISERGDFYGYAWTETVGWINFCGAHVELTAPLTSTLTTEPNPTDGEPAPGGDLGPDGIPGSGDEGLGGETSAGGAAVYANGVDSHRIIVQLRQNGAVLTENPNENGHTVAISALSFENSLRADQVTRCSQADDGTDLSPCSYNGAIVPTAGSFIWDDDRDGFVTHIRAIAPTIGTDRITLNSVSVVIDGITYPLETSTSFSFLPPVFVSGIHSQDSESVEAVRGTSEPIAVEAGVVRRDGDVLPADDTDINVFVQLYDCSSNFDFRFDDDAAEALGVERDENTGILGDQNLGDTRDRVNFDRPDSVCTTGGGELADIASDVSFTTIRTVALFSDVQDADSTAPVSINIDNAFGFRTRVEYAATVGAEARSVRYFSLVLPDQSLLNQAADVRGNVRIDIQKIIREGAIAQSLKNNPKDTQSKREKFYRAVKNTINTHGLSAIPGIVRNEALYLTNDTPLPPGNGLLYYNRINLPSDGPCKIILNNEVGNLEFERNVTLVGEGCDFFIDQNIISPSGRLGIVALEDLSLSSSRRGGNVYICHRVTDVEANIVADGSIFAYGAGETDCGAATYPAKDALLDVDGLPNPRGTRDTALRQLTIVGSIVSNNTYGGAFMSPPILGDGTRVTDSTQIPQARLYDMNFLRYARTQPGLEPGETCWESEILLSRTLAGGVEQTGRIACDSYSGNNPDEAGIVNIIYRAPAKDMKIFGAIR